MSNYGDQIIVSMFDKMTEKNLRSLIERVMRKGSLNGRDVGEQILFSFFGGDHRAFIKRALKYIKDNYGSEKAKAAMRNRLAREQRNRNKMNEELFSSLNSPGLNAISNLIKKSSGIINGFDVLSKKTNERKTKIANSAKIAREGLEKIKERRKSKKKQKTGGLTKEFLNSQNYSKLQQLLDQLRLRKNSTNKKTLDIFKQFEITSVKDAIEYLQKHMMEKYPLTYLRPLHLPGSYRNIVQNFVPRPRLVRVKVPTQYEIAIMTPLPNNSPKKVSPKNIPSSSGCRSPTKKKKSSSSNNNSNNDDIFNKIKSIREKGKYTSKQNLRNRIDRLFE